MRLFATIAFAIVAAALPAFAQRTSNPAYYPDVEWQHRRPIDVGMDSAKLATAIAYAISKESPEPRNLELAHYETFGREPFGEAVGPFKERGDATGVIVRHGYIVAEWGDPRRVDMTFSVTKSFLSTTVGLAVEHGLIRDVHDRVRDYVGPIVPFNASHNPAERVGTPTVIQLFESEHNRRITWETLLRQTSDWEGTLWGKPDWADRPGPNPSEWMTRVHAEPGSTYKYNDTRVNVLALAALNVWRRPLPQVLKEFVMDPIGASPTWRWYGYENSWVVIDGQAMQSVSGGGHWGGGMFIDAYDMARFGLLTLRRGKWKDRQLIPETWVRMALTPTTVQPTYGFMNWFLNTDRKLYPSAPPTAFAHLGNGANVIYVDPDNDIVAVVRWIQSGGIDGFIQRLLASTGNGSP